MISAGERRHAFVARASRAWLVAGFVVLMLGARRADACDKGSQPWKSSGGVVCLPDGMNSYVTCLEVTSHGQLSIERDDSGGSSSKVKVGANGSGGGPLVHGEGTVSVDVENAELAIRTLKQTFDPRNTTNCYQGAFGAPKRPGLRPDEPKVRKKSVSSSKVSVPALPGAGEPCTAERKCAAGTECRERLRPAALRTLVAADTGQRGPVNGDDTTFDAGGDCPPSTIRAGSPHADHSSDTTCAASWLTAAASDCRVRVHWSHGLGRWHCKVSYDVRERTSDGLYCQPVNSVSAE
jgi:hypothetical protein